MSPQQALDHFGTKTAMAAIAGTHVSTVTDWFNRYGYIPERAQWRFQAASENKLKVDPELIGMVVSIQVIERAA